MGKSIPSSVQMLVIADIIEATGKIPETGLDIIVLDGYEAGEGQEACSSASRTALYLRQLAYRHIAMWTRFLNFIAQQGRQWVNGKAVVIRPVCEGTT